MRNLLITRSRLFRVAFRYLPSSVITLARVSKDAKFISSRTRVIEVLLNWESQLGNPDALAVSSLLEFLTEEEAGCRRRGTDLG